MKQSTLIAGLVVAVLILAVALVFALRPRTVTVNPADASTLPQIVLRDDVGVKINSTREMSSIPSGEFQRTPGVNEIFLVCNLTITNHSSAPVQIDLSDLRISDASGRFYIADTAETTSVFTNSNRYQTSLSPNQSVTDDVSFHVPPGTKPVTAGVDTWKRTTTR